MTLIGLCMRCDRHFLGEQCPECDHDAASRWCDKDGNECSKEAAVFVPAPRCPYCQDTLIHPDDPTGQADCGYCGGSFRTGAPI